MFFQDNMHPVNIAREYSFNIYPGYGAFLNPIKAGGSESMYSLGGASHAPPLEKGLRE